MIGCTLTLRLYSQSAARAARMLLPVITGTMAAPMDGPVSSPAAFASVFVAALGDRGNTWKTAAAIGAAMSVFGVLVFHYGLRVQMPLLAWGS